MSCPLCERARDARNYGGGELPVYEDAVATVLVDAARRGQAWVIPKVHYRTLSDLDERTEHHLRKLGQRAALSLGASDEKPAQVVLDDDLTAADPHIHVRVRASS
jgi:diadenosine tetraphosphate (Ap4A) HIT family hydrolase